jgi:hypothetical protein
LARIGQRDWSCPYKASQTGLNGKVERSHRIDEEEFYRLLEEVSVDDTNPFNEIVGLCV